VPLHRRRASRRGEAAVLEIKSLQAGYEYLQVIWDVSLSISSGEFVVLLGPNGAGKTTLLRAVAGILRPRGGEVLFMGKPIAGLTTDQITSRGLSFITEDSNLFTAMSVRDNLLLGAYTVRNAQQIRDSLDFVYNVFPVLKERQKQAAGTLSGGERKMLAIGRSMMARPRLYLIDEPSLGLAPKTTATVFEALRELNQRGDTVLLVEQNVSTGLQLSQRGYVLEQGRIVLEGPSSALLDNPYVQQVYLGLDGVPA
jgi:branched-chain amino acid transport system ATP-binding protein